MLLANKSSFFLDAIIFAFLFTYIDNFALICIEWMFLLMESYSIELLLHFLINSQFIAIIIVIISIHH